MSKSIQQFVNGIDWKLLRQQKEDLLDVIHQGVSIDSMNGILSMIDELQDVAVDSGLFTSSEVFGTTKTVNLYYFTSVTIPKAASAKDAAILAFNGDYSWLIRCGGYDTSWEFNSCMLIDVYDVNDVQQDEFSPDDVSGETPSDTEGSGQTYKVSFYVNVQVVVTNADDDEDAIQKALTAGIDEELASDDGYDVDIHLSDSVQATVVGSNEDND